MVPEDDAYRTWELEDRYSIEPEWAAGKVMSLLYTTKGVVA